MSTVAYRSDSIPVEGGTLRFGVWGDSGPVVVCSHGLTANHQSFYALAQLLGQDHRLVAVDHRGRGKSRDFSGPWGMAHHADDIAACLNHLGIERADWIVGHSMGGFVSAVTKARYPERIGKVLLVDGGLPLVAELPEGMSTEQLIEAIVGPAMARLDQVFESVDAYYDFWKDHPALGPYWNPTFEHYFAYDLFGEAPELRPTAKREAIIGDTESQLISDLVPNSLKQIDEPVQFLWAPRGMFDAEPLYTEDKLTEALAGYPQVNRINAADVNHYTVLCSEQGAVQVANLVRS